jgi:hypothetical protein
LGATRFCDVGQKAIAKIYIIACVGASKSRLIYRTLFVLKQMLAFLSQSGVQVSSEQKTGFSLKVLSSKDFIEGCSN